MVYSFGALDLETLIFRFIHEGHLKFILKVAMEGEWGRMMVDCWFGYSLTLLLVRFLVFGPCYCVRRVAGWWMGGAFGLNCQLWFFFDYEF